ncbi:MAG: transglutaminase family protein [Leeuwenhoekiella sp.]
MKYTIKYKAHNTYEVSVAEALWQFLIIPENNDSQEVIREDFKNSLRVAVENSINGYGFNTYRIHPKKEFSEIEFEAVFEVIKGSVNPYEQVDMPNIEKDYLLIYSLEFQTEHEPFLRNTSLTTLPLTAGNIFEFDKGISIFENLKNLNNWIYSSFNYKSNVTTIETNLEEILTTKEGVCQDFTHIFCAVARQYKIPTRYVSGYLNQGVGYVGDSQMHAWVECFIPNKGWVGYDPTNNLLAADNHIKVAHGKDYTDCPPIKGVLYTSGKNETTYSVEVTKDDDNYETFSQTQNSDGILQVQQMGSMKQVQKQQQQGKTVKSS